MCTPEVYKQFAQQSGGAKMLPTSMGARLD